MKRTLGDIGLELCKEAAEEFKDFCPDEQFVQGTLCLDICAWDPSYSKTQVYRSKPFCCNECSFSSKFYSGYKNHFRNVHRRIFDRILLNCPYCTFTANKRNMEIHVRIFHQSRLPQSSSANAVATHPYATSRQKNNTYLGKARQTETVEKAVYYCKKCTFRDSLYNVVRRHIYREHFQHVVSPYLAMASNSNVKNGVSSINGNTILCKRCQFSTRSYEALVQHVVEYHERIGAQVTAMVGHANIMVGRPQASPLMFQKAQTIGNRAASLPNDPAARPVIGYLKPSVKTYSPGAPTKAPGLTDKATLAENNVNTSQTQKWKICTVCNELFPENLYSAHFESAHKAKKVWAQAKYIMKIHNFTSKCLLCNRYLPSDTLLNHVLIHGLACPQCHSAFHSIEKLIEHGNVAHIIPFEGPPGASPLTFDLALKQDKSNNVQLLVLTFNTNDSVNGQDDIMLNSMALGKLPVQNMYDKKSQLMAKNMLPSYSGRPEMGKTLCPLCFTIIKGSISDALALHLRQRHQVLQTMHPVEKKMTYKCIHCLGVYTSNMVASTITLHLVQCRAVGRSQAALAMKSPLGLGAPGPAFLKRRLPMQGMSDPKRINLGKDFASGGQGRFDCLALDPSSFEHKTYEARKDFLTAYFNRRPYASAQEKEMLAAKLWLWKADIATHFALKQRICEKQCETSKVSVLLGFDMNIVKKLKHDIIFERDVDASTWQENVELKTAASNCTTKPGVCMETIALDSDSEPEMENKPTENNSVDQNQKNEIEAEIRQGSSLDIIEVEGEADKPLPTFETQSDTEMFKRESTEEMDTVEKEDIAMFTKETQIQPKTFKQESTEEMEVEAGAETSMSTFEIQNDTEVGMDVMETVADEDKPMTTNESQTVADDNAETTENIHMRKSVIVEDFSITDKDSSVNYFSIV